jgi:hypothetical protein
MKAGKRAAHTLVYTAPAELAAATRSLLAGNLAYDLLVIANRAAQRWRGAQYLPVSIATGR